jgi:hypothetical protein
MASGSAAMLRPSTPIIACGDFEFPLVELLHALRGIERPLRIEGKLLIDSLVATRPQTDF